MIIDKRIKTYILIGVVLVLVIIAATSKSKVFVPTNSIYTLEEFEMAKSQELISCQRDCTMNDGQYHEECEGFNGCEESEYLKNTQFCHEDEDCVQNTGCCLETCEGVDCLDKKYCPVTNEEYNIKHAQGCEWGIVCNKTSSCKPVNEASCINNRCHIVMDE